MLCILHLPHRCTNLLGVFIQAYRDSPDEGAKFWGSPGILANDSIGWQHTS